MVPVVGADTIVTFDDKPAPIGLQDLVGSQCLEDEFNPLILVVLREYSVSNSEGFAASMQALFEGPFVPGLRIFPCIPY